MCEDYSGISSLGITNTSVQNIAVRIPSVKTVPK